MTTLARRPSLHRRTTGRSPRAATRCARSASKPLTPKWLRDPQLGPCCMECAPHVINADKLMYFMRFAK
jgi:hypothetical protein